MVSQFGIAGRSVKLPFLSHPFPLFLPLYQLQRMIAWSSHFLAIGTSPVIEFLFSRLSKRMARTAWMNENEPSDAEIRGEILRQLMLQRRDATISPMDVARELFSRWREKMDRVKEVISQMAVAGQIEVLTLRGDPTEIESAKGQVRLRLVPMDLGKVEIDDEPD